VPRYDVPSAAPEPLALVQRFVNTVDHEHHRELLSTPAALAEWIGDAGLDTKGGATGGDLRRARELREALRELLIANGRGAAPPPAAVATVNRAARGGGLAVALEASGRPGLVATRSGLAGALAEIVGVAVTAMLEGSWTRLKACRNCHWAFYDYSRNRSATWCSMSICGNRLKTRRYRKRAAIRRGDRARA
jgi:predicted RNA-binding Zn ribbon-like protein